MHAFRPIKRFALDLFALALVALVAAGLTGCTWTGKGKEVAQAMEKTAQFKSRSFNGAIDFKMSGADAAKSTQMTFKGASDNSDPANPKLTMTVGGAGEAFTMAMPGDGNVYMVTPAGTFGAPVPPAERSKTALDVGGIYDALGKAIGDFQTAQPMQNANGQPVPTIYAKVDRGKVCNKVLPEFGELMSKASAGTGTGTGAAGLGALGSGGGNSMGQFCKVLLVSDPQVWFGITDGALTDVALDAAMAFPGAGAMTFALQYHEFNQGQPQPSIKKPNGATMYPSLQAIGPALAGAQ